MKDDVEILKLQALTDIKVFHRKMWKKNGDTWFFPDSIASEALKLQALFGVWKSVHEQKRNARLRGKK